MTDPIKSALDSLHSNPAPAYKRWPVIGYVSVVIRIGFEKTEIEAEARGERLPAIAPSMHEPESARTWAIYELTYRGVDLLRLLTADQVREAEERLECGE